MSYPSDPTFFLNRDAASDYVENTKDPIVQRILRRALGAATVRMLRTHGESEASYRARLPAAPFDLLFYMQVVEALVAKREAVLRLLQGLPDEDLFG